MNDYNGNGKGNEGKGNEGKGNEGKRNEGKRNEGKRNEGKRNEGKRNEGKGNEGIKNEDKKNEGKGYDFRQGDGEKKDGYPKAWFDPKYTRRKRDEDYHGPQTYHIILKKLQECGDFGQVGGDPRIRPGEAGCAIIMRSDLGWIIEREIFAWPKFYPILKVYQHIVMPDHVHILVRITERSEKNLGFFVNKLKGAIKFKWNQKMGMVTPPIFEKNYTDKIIFPSRSLKDIIIYIKHNPHRLAVRIYFPEFFRRVRNIRIKGELWQCYGNVFLLRSPFKEALIVHRKDIEDKGKMTLMKEYYLENIDDDGVVVSAFISKGEKMIRDAIAESHGRMIHIQEKPFGDRFKPEKRRFDLCSDGNLLIMAPMAPLALPSRRAECLHLNVIAEAIAAGEFEI